MTKKQKTWLWVFIAMFAVPEILWSPVLTYILPFFLGSNYKFRNSFLFSGNVSQLLLTLIMFVQCLGIISATAIFHKQREELRYKTAIITLFSLLSLVAVIVLYLQITISGSDLLGF